ncbi:hypothetical protein CLOM_g24489, partial [Closterium sp. NIES-68]
LYSSVIQSRLFCSSPNSRPRFLSPLESPPAPLPESLFAPLSAALPDRLSGASFTQGRPLVKGRVFVCYVARLRPTRSNGKVVGDKGVK